MLSVHEVATTTTWNGAASHSTTGTARVDFFYAASRGIEQERLLTLLESSYTEEPLHTLKIVAYCRDIRGGKGERKLTRQCLTWLASNATTALSHNLIHYIAEYGRFDDVLALMGTPLEDAGLDLWAKQLRQDLSLLEKEEPISISLAAKWIPSENKSADKETRVNKKLCKKLGLKNAGELRKQYLAPLRRKLDILERLMCAKDWDAIQFSHVPSVALKIHGRKDKAFQRNLGEKFDSYKESLAKGETKVNAKDLFPHQIAQHYIRHGEFDELVEAQWRGMLEKGSQLGDLSNVLIMSDVSGSMSGLPMDISIALGILVSTLTSAEWKGLVMTFESTPRFHMVTGNTLQKQVQCLASAPWGGSTNFIAALDLILATARKGKLSKAAMPKRLIVVSDMQFDYASEGCTNYDSLVTRYSNAGYEVPHIVFWNVNGNTSDFPTTSAMPNVSLISGYSADVLKAVLKGDQISPFTTMLNAILDERYNRIQLPPTSPL
ncbi:UNVERIFIED_CONTAM: hypothetical protein HDU68_002348 [Siphonaria sp. JEL0065]|nr:hypothetical protein HDU68_002348 [Siphonaria sp. JEL0065]